jgi:hypothetical protein
MKRTATYLIILIALFLGCKKVDNSTGTPPIPPIKKDKISGLVQKGPYINGTQIIMYVLDDKLAQTGKVFNTQITDNKGSFQLTNVELSSKFVQLAANGYYFNEASNAITIAPLQLNALTDVTDASTINVNILTHLEKRRVEYLVKSGKTFTEAKKTAQQEIQAIFGIQIAQSTVSEKLDIATAGDANAILLAISLIIQGELSVGDLSELLATISADLEEDGLMTNNSVMTKLRANAKLLHLDSIRQNLVKRYQDLGVTATIPDFEKYINVFLVQSAEKPSAESKAARLILNHTATLIGTVNPNGAETVVTFEYGVTASYGSSIVAKESPLYFDTARSVSADIINLDSLTTYHYRIKAENGKGITYSADSTFITIKDEVDIVSGLVAYYPFSGNANDQSGNGYNGILNGPVETTDRFGNVKSAYSFLANSTNRIRVSNATEINNLSNMSISLWVNFNSWGRSGQPGWNRFINSEDEVTSNTQFVFANANAGLYFYYGGFNYFLTSTLPPLASWHHLVVTYNYDGIHENSKCNFYVDGIMTDSFNTTANIQHQNYNLYIGSRFDGSIEQTTDGKLDDIRIYNRALTPMQINYLATH